MLLSHYSNPFSVLCCQHPLECRFESNITAAAEASEDVSTTRIKAPAALQRNPSFVKREEVLIEVSSVLHDEYEQCE